jgi:murein DD-endopeptidase MepM/ murein hydrolase activator NlpD
MGNLIVIKCVDNYVTLSNLRNGSIRVKPGDKVNYTLMVAMVGNTTGNSFPHLHIQVNKGSRDGQPIPMLFDHFQSVDRFIVRNLLTLR